MEKVKHGMSSSSRPSLLPPVLHHPFAIAAFDYQLRSRCRRPLELAPCFAPMPAPTCDQRTHVHGPRTHLLDKAIHRLRYPAQTKAKVYR
ncbi:hypothetical protein NEOLEDRAFT_992084 [Neolentinus lepideus HHB14362 ss-1]|uniref:Uncharacterized protein n=1 Tax=Neolentinus lepideus HHB14362 ss-1 TaxID=1314782 RepID=A0A165N3L9_9AGAM|nr:hypothetical protein NEOLEDRAFT_992084 [Neolentinus lepideus HHB14362 ss-1]